MIQQRERELWEQQLDFAQTGPCRSGQSGLERSKDSSLMVTGAGRDRGCQGTLHCDDLWTLLLDYSSYSVAIAPGDPITILCELSPQNYIF